MDGLSAILSDLIIQDSNNTIFLNIGVLSNSEYDSILIPEEYAIRARDKLYGSLCILSDIFIFESMFLNTKLIMI